MERAARLRKVCHDKENDHKHGNKRREHIDVMASLNIKKMGDPKSFVSVPTLLQSVNLGKPRRQTFKTNTEQYCSLYSKTILQNESSLQKPPKSLKNHDIDPYLRTRMLDWMVQVTGSYKFRNKTYFDGVHLLDRYFSNQTNTLLPAQLHISGCISMLIASKMEEVYPLKIKTVYEKIAHRKIDRQELIRMEARIMEILEFKLNSWTFFDLAMLKINLCFNQKKTQGNHILGELFSARQSLEPNNSSKLNEAQQLCDYLAKHILYDYDFYCENSMILMSQTLVNACFEILDIECNIKDFYTCSSILIELNKQKLYKTIKNYKKNFNGLTNIFKFTSKEIIGKVQSAIE